MAVNNLNFAATIDSFVAATEQRMTAVFREATQRTISKAQSRIPIDTGFARASVRASTASMPPIESGSRPEPGRSYAYDGGEVALTIANAQLGQTIYAGWTASYVQFLEYGHSKQAPAGFVGISAAEWPATVNQVTEELKARVRAQL